MRQLVDAESSAGPTGALGIVEDEELGLNLAVHEVMGRAAQTTVESFRLRLAGALENLHLEQSVADEQRCGNGRLDRFLVFPADDQPIDHGLHMPDARLVELHLLG